MKMTISDTLSEAIRKAPEGRKPQVDRSIPHDRAGSPRRATEPKETAGFLSPLRGFGEGRDRDVGPSWGSRPRLHPAAPFGAKTTSRTATKIVAPRIVQPCNHAEGEFVQWASVVDLRASE